MLSRATGLPLSQISPSYAAQDAAASVPIAAVVAAVPAAALVVSQEELARPTLYDGLSAPSRAAGHVNERAAAHAFWLPNDSWRSIAAFSSQEDLFNVRASNRTIKRQVDHAITTVIIRGSEVPAFIQSNSFAKLHTLRLEYAGEDDLLLLAVHLAAHRRPNLTLELAHFDLLTARGMTALPALPLARLHLVGSPPVEGLDALAACSYPVTLRGHLWGGRFLGAALRIPTLEKLVAYGEVIEHSCDQQLAYHPALEVLHIGIANQAATIGVLATLPRLRELCLYIGMNTVELLSPESAGALAASSRLETLTIVSTRFLSEESLSALSQSRSLINLTMPIFQGMRALSDMQSLRHLAFNNSTSFGNLIIVSAETMQNIATAPSLQSISFPDRPFEPGALIALFKDSGASMLEFKHKMVFNEDERTALMANTKLSRLVFGKGVAQESDVALLCNHPTLERLRVNDVEYRRLPEQAVLTLRNEVA